MAQDSEKLRWMRNRRDDGRFNSDYTKFETEGAIYKFETTQPVIDAQRIGEQIVFYLLDGTFLVQKYEG